MHPCDRDAIARLSRRGVPTTIVTGRLFSGTRAIAAEIGAAGPIGCADGSHVVDAVTGRDVHHAGIAGEHAARVRDVVERLCGAAFVFAHDQIVHDEAGAPYLGYVRTWSRDVVRASRVTDHPHWEHARGLTAVVALGDKERIDEAHGEIGRSLATAAQTAVFPVNASRLPSAGRRGVHEGYWALLVRAAGADKGTALERVAHHHGVRLDEVVVVGDWFNDLPMFAKAGRSFAMAQAPDRVKEAATDRLDADTASGGGIAEAIERSGMG